jgi:hypothetical protein
MMLSLTYESAGIIEKEKESSCHKHLEIFCIFSATQHRTCRSRKVSPFEELCPDISMGSAGSSSKSIT